MLAVMPLAALIWTPVKIWDELKERRITQVVIAYLAGGWIVLAGVDQLVDRQVLPELYYRLALVLFVGGIAAALILGWYHGEKGKQEATLPELVMLAVVTVITLVSGVFVARAHLEAERLAEMAEFRPGPDPRAGGLDPARIAVLYFEDRSRDGQLAHIADGLTESLIAELSGVGALDVISVNGALQFKDSALPRDSIARALSAGTVVTGTVEPERDRVRVSIGISDGVSGAEFRRGTLERPEEELLDLSAGVVEEVSRLLREWLGEEIELRRRADETSDAAAWALLQRGERARKQAEDRLEADDLEGVITAFQEADSLLAEAEARDPAWARPPTVRGQVFLRLAQLSMSDPFEASSYVEQGLEHVATALQRDARFAPALETRGILRYLGWDLGMERQAAAAERLIERAEEDLVTATRLDPTRATAWNVLSIIHSQKPDPINAKLAASRAYSEDAFLRAAEGLLWRLYATSYDLEQFADAVYYCEEGQRRFPDHFRFHECELWLLASRARQPDVDRAWELQRRYRELRGAEEGDYWDRHGRIIVGGVLARAGMPDSANAVFLDARPTPDVDPTRELLGLEAVFRLQMGQEQEALDLVRTYLTASPAHRGGWRWSAHWWWRPLQGNQEFQDLIGGGASLTGN
jgi:TolB-like protein